MNTLMLLGKTQVNNRPVARLSTSEEKGQQFCAYLIEDESDSNLEEGRSMKAELYGHVYGDLEICGAASEDSFNLYPDAINEDTGEEILGEDLPYMECVRGLVKSSEVLQYLDKDSKTFRLLVETRNHLVFLLNGESESDILPGDMITAKAVKVSAKVQKI